MQLGIVARADDTGLGNQTRNLVYMLKPDKVLIIDSTPFNNNKQNFHWYDGFNIDKTMGAPNINQYLEWSKGLTHVLCAESFMNDNFVNRAMRLNIKTYIQANFEFMDAYIRPMTPPTLYLMPSHWMLEEVKAKYPSTIYLPPPLFPNDFKEARQTNLKRLGKPRFLHVVGKWASKDRNGTKSLFEALRYTNEDFELIVKTQYPLDFYIDDPRVKVDVSQAIDPQDLYKDFDAMILPRRYGGLCLPLNEALMSGLPVIMTDISPQNQVLPPEWLIPASVHDKLQTRMVLDVYNADPLMLASKINWLCNTDITEEKVKAFGIGMTYSADVLKPKYMELFT